MSVESDHVKIITYAHSGVIYTFDYRDCVPYTPPVAKYIEMKREGGDYFYRYELSGAHEGPPFVVLVKNAYPEWDTDNYHIEWDAILWADDRTPWLSENGDYEDAYWDALRDDLRAFDWE